MNLDHNSIKNHSLFLELFEKKFSSFFLSFYKDETPLNTAIIYALQAQGKRVRPFLSFLIYDLFCTDYDQLFPAVLSLEMVHCYSLVHDDLPILDNDDYRRNRLTVHKKFDEATALLVGNALLSDAFYLLTTQEQEVSHYNLVKELSLAIGSLGMVKGQMLDVFWTAKSQPSLSDLEQIHILKTAKLLSVSCAFGAICAQQSLSVIERVKKFGHHLGLAYQIIDDLLDKSKNTGKSQGKDESQNKLTYLKLFTKDKAYSLAKDHTNKALSYIKGLSSKNKEDQVVSFCKKLLSRYY